MRAAVLLTLLGGTNAFNAAATHRFVVRSCSSIKCSAPVCTTTRIRKRDRVANAFKGLVRRVKPVEEDVEAEVVSWYDSGARLAPEPAPTETELPVEAAEAEVPVWATTEGVQSWFDSGLRLTAEEELSEDKQLMQKVKDAGVAGLISYVFWEWAFWGVSVPVCIAGYQAATGHWPDFSNQDDLAKLGAEAFAFVNVARFAMPLRIGLALGTTPWVQTNIVDKFQKKEEEKDD